MKCRKLATRTELLELHAVRIVAAILLCNVITFFAIDAGHGDLRTYVRALTCHGLTPSLVIEGPRLPEATQCAKFAQEVLVAGAGLEPTTQRL